MVQLDIYNFLYEQFTFKGCKSLKLFEAFSGIGTQSMALKRLEKEFNFKLDVIGISEVDEYALKSYEAIHGKVKNYGGIGSFEALPPNIDIAFWSFPCQNISLAGDKEGMVEGSQSNYGYDFLDTVKRTKIKPKVLIMENVKNLLSETFIDDFNEINKRLVEMGYTNYDKVLKGSDYGIPQMRERVFLVSFLGEYSFNFPPPIRLEKSLHDLLETNVSDKYLLSENMLRVFTDPKVQKGGYVRSSQFRPHDKNSHIAYTITTKAGGRATDNFLLVDNTTKEDVERIVDLRRKGLINLDEVKLKDTLKIRKLTPLEIWRLTGISDEDFKKAKSVVSNTQLYKQAGNAIVVDVLYYIFRELFR